MGKELEPSDSDRCLAYAAQAHVATISRLHRAAKYHIQVCMLDPPAPAPLSLFSIATFDQSPRRAFAAMSDQDRDVWHLRYCPQEGAEHDQSDLV